MMRRSRLLLASIVLTGALCASGIFSSAVSAAVPKLMRVGSAPPAPAGARVLGTLPASIQIRVTVTLAPRDPAALEAYALAVSTPGSGAYRDRLTVAQFAQRFAPTAAQSAAVQSSLRARGLSPGAVSANGLAIPVIATASRIAQAFSTSLKSYALPHSRLAFANAVAPSFDASVARYVQGVVGLDTLATPRPLGLARRVGVARRDGLAPREGMARRDGPARPHSIIRPDERSAARATPHVATGGPQPCAAALSAASKYPITYTADQLASAYRFTSLYTAGDLGAGQTIAIYELEPYAPSDIATYQSCYGTSTPVSNLPVDGGAGSGAGMGEAALDIEDVIGLAPKANVLVYSGPNSASGSPGSGPYDTYAAIISQDRAQVISTTWGNCEPREGSSEAQGESTLFEEAAVQGQTIVAAAGDGGAEDCSDQSGAPIGGPAVDDPASQPFVTGVGGTTLHTPGPPPNETVWNEAARTPPAGAGGGGISALWPMLSYQSSAPASLHVVNAASSAAPCGSRTTLCREVPDVSADADPFTGYLIYFTGTGTGVRGWTPVGGTSGAEPLWAALLALTNASRACGGSAIGFANPVLYRAAASALPSAFNDIISGENDYTGAGGFIAGPGYDMASGLGTPNGTTLPAALCDRVSVSSPGPQATVLGTATSVRLTALSTAGARLSFAAAGLPAGLSVNASSGVISGATTKVGSSTVTVLVRDSDGAVGSTSFRWSVIAPAVVIANHGNHTGTVHKPVRLLITATVSNRSHPAFRFGASGLPPGLSINSRTGLISGKPRTAGRFAVSLAATAAGGGLGRSRFSWTIGGLPGTSRTSFTGLGRGAPKLSLTVIAGRHTPGIDILVIGLPPGSRFDTPGNSGKRLAAAITVIGPNGRRTKFLAKVSRGALSVTLRAPVAKLRLTVAAPAIRLRSGLAAQVAARNVKQIGVVVRAIDAHRQSTRLALKIAAS
ncbi:MAG: protease pro-enzyme activation domain-containing protein [Actinomycetota bacterium]|nr:protease pro-enzyme activation domain-containing protein [Actinomycetota bacterium]